MFGAGVGWFRPRPIQRRAISFGEVAEGHQDANGEQGDSAHAHGDEKDPHKDVANSVATDRSRAVPVTFFDPFPGRAVPPA
jgi:hypothetical protein